MNIAKFLRKPIFTEHLWWLLPVFSKTVYQGAPIFLPVPKLKRRDTAKCYQIVADFLVNKLHVSRGILCIYKQLTRGEAFWGPYWASITKLFWTVIRLFLKTFHHKCWKAATGGVLGKKVVLENLAIFTRKNLFWRLILIKEIIILLDKEVKLYYKETPA